MQARRDERRQYVKISLQDKKRDRKNRRREKPWTVAEVQRFIKGIERDRLYVPLLLSLMGLRPAEVCGVRWTDVDLKLSTLETANTRTMVGNKTVLEKDTKTLARVSVSCRCRARPRRPSRSSARGRPARS
ncbi:hypothetical protein AB0P36_20235 [Streptomyces flavidovirens]|uniref:hypothetical protein n=1 Tax=Streptomyces flavidovirens TaxID=67298 RepID=UPI00344A855B